ncbi:hypothetical protein Tco_1281414, partial [Tanacetum coccineum]
MKLFKIGTFRRKDLDKENVSKHGRNLKKRTMFEEGDFDDLDDMVNEGIENVEGDTVDVNTGTTGVRASVSTASISISTAKPRTPPTTTTTAFEDEDLTIAQTLLKMRSEKAKEKEKEKGVAFKDEEESARSTTIFPTIDLKDKGKGIMQEPKKPPKNPRKAQIQMDEELAIRLHEEEKAELERIMDTYALLAERLQEEEREQFSIDEQARFFVETIAERKRFTYNQLKNKSLEEIQKLYEREQKWINYFVPMDSEMVKDSGKEAESKDDAEKDELRACLDVVPWDDIAINVESLDTKYLIVDWKTHILIENMMYYQIIRADGSSKNYKIFSEMLNDFNKQDVVDLQKLVKESWRLFDSCGIHVLLMDTGVAIHMMVENKYPLTQEMLLRMLNRRLEVDHESTMAFKFIRFIKAEWVSNAQGDLCGVLDVVKNIMHADSVSINVLPANNKCLVHDNLEIERLEQENDHLFELLLSHDIVHICVNSLATLTNYVKIGQDYIHEYSENLVLKA